MSDQPTDPTTCALPGCTEVIEQADAGGPPRRYCSSAHRAAARKHRQVARAELTAALTAAVAESGQKTQPVEREPVTERIALTAPDPEPVTERVERAPVAEVVAASAPAPAISAVDEDEDPLTEVVRPADLEPKVAPEPEPEPVTVRIRPALSGAATRPAAFRNPFRVAATASGTQTKRVLRPEKRPTLRSERKATATERRRRAVASIAIASLVVGGSGYVVANAPTASPSRPHCRSRRRTTAATGRPGPTSRWPA